MKHDITNKIVLVSGAGGSIGSELCRQICKQNPKKLILIDHSEYSLYKIYEELSRLNSPKKSIKIVASLSSITNKKLLENLFQKTRPDIIFHTAAYKHVHLVEENKIEGIYNNIFGTKILTEAAIKKGVKKFVLISTDKAVRPSCMMGASKRVAEMILQAFSKTQSKTLFSIVRFGNVLESSGSVIPLFKSQIHNGGPVTITHKRASRYFMTITEAAELVIQASAMTKSPSKLSQSAPIYLLEMGKPVKIIDLAKLMVELYGLTIYDHTKKSGDIKIKIIGLRKGEKIKEELLINGNVSKTDHPKIKYVYESYLPWSELVKSISLMNKLISKRNEEELEKAILKLVS